MMRTEETGRISLEETFTSGTPSPENASEKSGISTAKDGEEEKVLQNATCWMTCQTAMGCLFPPCLPLFPPACWESVATSWLLPDPLFYTLRVLVFGTILGIYIVLCGNEREKMGGNLGEVYVMGMLVSAGLLVPIAMLYVVGPLEDWLDGEGIGWMWGVLGGLVQNGICFVWMVGIRGVGGGGRKEIMWSGVVGGILGAEVLLGRIAGRIEWVGVGGLGFMVWVYGNGRNGEGGGGGGEWRLIVGFLTIGMLMVIWGKGREKLGKWMEK